MRSPRTKKEILRDPRVAKIDGKRNRAESDILWREVDDCGDASWWCSLADGLLIDHCTTIHERTLVEIGRRLNEAREGQPC